MPRNSWISSPLPPLIIAFHCLLFGLLFAVRCSLSVFLLLLIFLFLCPYFHSASNATKDCKVRQISRGFVSEGGAGCCSDFQKNGFLRKTNFLERGVLVGCCAITGSRNDDRAQTLLVETEKGVVSRAVDSFHRTDINAQ